LSELLAVEPSPEFAASVRARIERQPARAVAWPWWLGAVTAAAAVIAIAIVAGGRRAPAPATALPARADVQLSSPARELPRTIETNPTVAPRAVAVRALKRTPEPEPETLFDPSLAAAIRRLTSERRVLPAMPPEPSLSPVVVEPLTVPEITDAASKQGDRQ